MTRLFVLLSSLCLCSCAVQTPKSYTTVAKPASSHTASEALRALKRGNARFSHEHLKHAHQGMKRVHEIEGEQHPIAVVLSCADSRVTPEIVFDMGLGDLFVVREAGHVADDATLGSCEYAVEHLHVPLIVVLGHESCGAVSAALKCYDSKKPAPGHIQRLVEDINPAVKKAGTGTEEQRIARAVEENVRLVKRQLEQSNSILSEALTKGRLRIVGAVYDLHTGKVHWL